MLTQSEAETLIRMTKYFSLPRTISVPAGTDETYELVGEDKREQFLLDLWRATLRLSNEGQVSDSWKEDHCACAG
jgi:hypothetical protein